MGRGLDQRPPEPELFFRIIEGRYTQDSILGVQLYAFFWIER